MSKQTKLTPAQKLWETKFNHGWNVFRNVGSVQAHSAMEAARKLGRSARYDGLLIVSPVGVASKSLEWFAVAFLRVAFRSMSWSNKETEADLRRYQCERAAWVVRKFNLEEVLFALSEPYERRERIEISAEMKRQADTAELCKQWNVQPETLAKAEQYTVKLVRAMNPVTRSQIASELRTQVVGIDSVDQAKFFADIATSNLFAAGLVSATFKTNGYVDEVDFPESQYETQSGDSSISRMRRFSEYGVR